MVQLFMTVVFVCFVIQACQFLYDLPNGFALYVIHARLQQHLMPQIMDVYWLKFVLVWIAVKLN